MPHGMGYTLLAPATSINSGPAKKISPRRARQPKNGAEVFQRNPYSELLALLPEGTWRRTVRADRGFFDGQLLDFLEGRGWPYIVVARMTSTRKRKGAGIKEWPVMDEHRAAGEFTRPLFGGSKARRLVVVRERIRESQAAVGRRLIEVPGYTFRIWGTNRSEDALTL